MKAILLSVYRVFRAPLLFLASFVGIALFWVVFVSLINTAPSAGVPIKEFMDSITLFIWRTDEGINFFRHFAIALTVFYPAAPGLAIMLIEFLYKVYRVRRYGDDPDLVRI